MAMSALIKTPWNESDFVKERELEKQLQVERIGNVMNFVANYGERPNALDLRTGELWIRDIQFEKDVIRCLTSPDDPSMDEALLVASTLFKLERTLTHPLDPRQLLWHSFYLDETLAHEDNHMATSQKQSFEDWKATYAQAIQESRTGYPTLERVYREQSSHSIRNHLNWVLGQQFLKLIRGGK